jgi:hypothetical protein
MQVQLGASVWIAVIATTPYVVTAVATRRPLRDPQVVTHHGEPI